MNNQINYQLQDTIHTMIQDLYLEKQKIQALNETIEQKDEQFANAPWVNKGMVTKLQKLLHLLKKRNRETSEQNDRVRMDQKRSKQKMVLVRSKIK